MVVTGGLWAAFQHHLGRIMAYGSIAETGFSLIALSLDPRVGIPILFLLIPARALGLAVWSGHRGALVRPRACGATNTWASSSGSLERP